MHTAANGPLHSATFASGTAIASFPRGGRIAEFNLQDQSAHILHGKKVSDLVAVLGLYQPPLNNGMAKNPLLRLTHRAFTLL